MESDASGAASEITTVQSMMSGEDGKQVGEVAQPPKLRVGPKRPQAPYGCGPRHAKKKKERGPSSSERKPVKSDAGANAAIEAQPTEEKPNADNADSGDDADVESGGSERRGRRRLPPPPKSLRIRAINHRDFR